MGAAGDRRRHVVTDVAVPIVAAAAPTAAFQLPNLFVAPAVKIALVVAGLLVLGAVVAFQVRRGSRAASAADDLTNAVERVERQNELAVQYAFGQVATRLLRFADLPPAERRTELGAFADRVAIALAFYLLPSVPDIRANVFSLSADLERLEPIGHGGAGDTAGVFRAGTPFGDRNLEWVLTRGPRRIVADRAADVDAADDDPGFEPRYVSYASVVIGDADRSFGMLTVDSPAADAFADSDVESVVVMAAFMAVAFALAHPSHETHESRKRTR
jgi:hypothetical protein